MSCIDYLLYPYKVVFIKTFGQCRLCVCLCLEDILKFYIYQSAIIRDGAYNQVWLFLTGVSFKPSNGNFGILGFCPNQRGGGGSANPKFLSIFSPETKYALELSKSVMKYI